LAKQNLPDFKTFIPVSQHGSDECHDLFVMPRKLAVAEAVATYIIAMSRLRSQSREITYRCIIAGEDMKRHSSQVTGTADARDA